MTIIIFVLYFNRNFVQTFGQNLILKKEVSLVKNNLRVILATKKMKVSDLNKLTGISKGTLTNIFYERVNPTMETTIKIAKALNISIDELVKNN